MHNLIVTETLKKRRHFKPDSVWVERTIFPKDTTALESRTVSLCSEQSEVMAKKMKKGDSKAYKEKIT